ncbi:MAG: histidine kinase dimerization/phosphoacceptor domain-containing protein [Saprospiraceae bacterium]|nr:histidine kinase dimerization/phosphoacceptor domain-containing protein [Saprospiraceae bacterium]
MNKQLQDEVGANLSSLHVYADLAAKVSETNPKKSKVYLSKIAVQSQQIMEEIGDIIWIANVYENNVHDAFLTRIKNYSYEILNPSQISCEFDIDPIYYETVLSADFLKASLLVITSGMRSSIEDPEIKKITVSIKISDGNPHIELR